MIEECGTIVYVYLISRQVARKLARLVSQSNTKYRVISNPSLSIWFASVRFTIRDIMQTLFYSLCISRV